jgi:protein FRG1
MLNHGSFFDISQISRKFQTWNHGRVIVSNESVKELNKAKKEGRFSEALLDRREKLKSDRYCK